jgi:hypothetical protein
MAVRSTRFHHDFQGIREYHPASSFANNRGSLSAGPGSDLCMRVLRKVCLLAIAFACSIPHPVFGKQSAAPATQPAVEAKFDGPAELPRVYVKSALSDTPAPGSVHLIKNDGNLQAALDGAACGDVIKLEAGAIFAGQFRLPRKPCDDAHWIVIRTSASDNSLPPEGTRLTPCYAGVASLPGRPDFHCAFTKNAMAKIVFVGRGGSGPLLFADCANH